MISVYWTDLIECKEGGGEAGGDAEEEVESLLVAAPLAQLLQHLNRLQIDFESKI